MDDMEYNDSWWEYFCTKSLSNIIYPPLFAPSSFLHSAIGSVGEKLVSWLFAFSSPSFSLNSIVLLMVLISVIMILACIKKEGNRIWCGSVGQESCHKIPLNKTTRQAATSVKELLQHLKTNKPFGFSLLSFPCDQLSIMIFVGLLQHKNVPLIGKILLKPFPFQFFTLFFAVRNDPDLFIWLPWVEFGFVFMAPTAFHPSLPRPNCV